MNDRLSEVTAGIEQRKEAMLRVPLLLPAIFMGIGILLSYYSPGVVSGFWLAVCIAALIGTIFFSLQKRWMYLGVASVCVLMLALGGLRFDQTYRSVADDDIILYTGREPVFATITGRISSYPVVAFPENEFGYKPLPCIKYLLDVHAIKTGDTFTPAGGICNVTVHEPFAMPSPGDVVELVGTMGRYQGAENPGGSDVLATSRITGVSTWFKVPTYKGEKIIKPASAGGGLSVLRWRVRAFIRQRLTESGDIIDGQLVSALILGERQPGLRDLSKAMMRAGVAHFLSISGLHLGIFLVFIYFVCRMFMLGPRRSAIGVLIVLGLYLLLAEARAPMLRSAIMAACIAGGMAVGRRYSSYNALALAWLILLLIDPRQLLLPGFQLSFAIVAGLIFLSPKFQQLIFGWWYRRRGLAVFRDDQRFRRWAYYRFADIMIEFLTVSICAYLIATPLAMLHFGFFSPYALVLGFVLFPLVVGVLVPGYITMALAWPMPNLAGFFGSISSWFASLIVDFVGFAEKLPGLWVAIYPINGWWVALYFITLLAVLYSPGGRMRKYFAGAMVLVFAVVTVLTQLPSGGRGEAELNLLSVGRGQCAVLRSPDGENWLIDAGSMIPSTTADHTLLPFMRSRRLAFGDHAIITHGHPDHFSMLPQTVRQLGLGGNFAVHSSGYLFEDTFGGQNGMMIRELIANDVKFHTLAAGDRIELGRGLVGEILWPVKGLEGKTDANDLSLVIRFECGGRTLLMPGDISDYAQKRLLEHPEKLRADVLVMPHHGSWNKALPEFVAAVDPEIVLVSADARWNTNKSKPAREFYTNLLKQRRVYTTASSGWVCLTFGNAGIHVQTMRENERWR